MLEILSDLQIDINEESTSHVFVDEVLKDYAICVLSREVSVLARRDVLSGKGKFGITGDGKEVPNVALARSFRKGDIYSGYYRDQTMMFALGITDVKDYFAHLYADFYHDPFSGGRQMNNHFATPFIDKNGNWIEHKSKLNIVSGISSTAGQMPRSLGLAFASKIYRESEKLYDSTPFSNGGNEVCFTTIGDASTSEGVFWESLNACGVLQVPLAISVWDDGYGISVPTEYQTARGSISKILQGFIPEEGENGVKIYSAKGWDYPTLCEMYEKGIKHLRKNHQPALFHVKELTQPQGHSTSGSHERYKSKERLQWEKDNDCILKMREWILDSEMASEELLQKMEKQIKTYVRKEKNHAWKAYEDKVKAIQHSLVDTFSEAIEENEDNQVLKKGLQELQTILEPNIHDILKIGRKISLKTQDELISTWCSNLSQELSDTFGEHLYSSSPKAAINIAIEPAEYSTNSGIVNGFEILRENFDRLLERYDNLYIFGEDVGQIGDVNQGVAGLQAKYGEDRVFDTGIREWTIIGQALGMAMRGLRPIAEIQYLDYLVYALSILTDDISTLRYRSVGQQQCPVIIRTRGHRLEGIWHSGSPMGMLLNSLKGMYIIVPRNMVQAAGFYNTLMKSDDPALVIECLNGYRLKERMPENIGEFTVPLGVPEVIAEGEDITLVTYGSCVRIAQEALKSLKNMDVSVELIDIQTLLPFDLEHRIVESLKKTNRILFLDEDVPGGGTAFMMREVLEIQEGYQYLDSSPATLTSKKHRPPYGSVGDYVAKPNAEDIIEKVISILAEAEPERFS